MPAPTVIRPTSFDAVIGQRDAVARLRLAATAAMGRQEAVDHLLLSGPPGLGKTTLARCLATAVEAPITEVMAPGIDSPGRLAAIISSLLPRSVLFIDEIHALDQDTAEILYSAMEDFRMSIRIGEGKLDGEIMTIPVNPFTLVGATTNPGVLPKPFIARFPQQIRIDPYPTADLAVMVQQWAQHLGLTVEPEAATAIAASSRGTPREGQRLVRRVRDWVTVHGDGVTIDLGMACAGLATLGIDERGLDVRDRRYLQVLRDAKRAIGLETLAQIIDEETVTVETVVEPWLLMHGLIAKTPRGRIAV